MAGEGAWPVRIVSVGRAAAGAVAWRTQGRLSATFVVKATFTIVPGADMTLAEADDVVRAEVHHSDLPTRSIRLSSDLAPFLPRADVLLTGHAVSPARKPAAIVPVRLAVYRGQARIEKTINVYGDRKEGSPQPFERMPLVYERAFGGIGWQDNPLGIGFKGGKRVEPPVHNLLDPDDPYRTTGFGPISRAWPERRRLLGSFPRRDLELPIAEIPEGFDFTYFHAAPRDQRCEYLQGEEWVILEGVHPDLAQIKSRLPEARAVVRVEGLPIAVPPVALVADTLRIDADTLRCSVTWRGSLGLADEGWLAGMRVAAGVELPGHPVEWPAALPAAPRSAEVVFVERGMKGGEGTLVIVEDDHDHVSTEVVRLPPGGRPTAGASPAKPPTESPFRGTVELSEDASRRAGERAAVPFREPTFGERNAPALGVSDAAAAAPPAPAPVPARVAPVAAPPPARAERALTAPRDVPARATDGIPVVNRTSLVGFAMPCQVLPGQPARSVIVKGTFDLVPGEPARLRDETEPPTGDLHVGDDLERSVLYPSDFAPFKPRADVTLTAHAVAPGGSSPAGQVRFRFGRGKNLFDRRIAVFGERTWEGVVKTPSAPKRFTRVALVYENAFGGPAFPQNPVGLGHAGDTRPPLLEDPDHLIAGPADAPEPVGFGALPSVWPARAALAGTYGAEWQRTRWPYFPDDFDWGFFQAAPRAQQLDHLEGDEPFELSGMHPQHPMLHGTLPRLHPRCFAQNTTAAGGAFREVALRLDTATFDVDEMKLTLVWRGLLSASGDEAIDLAELFLVLEEAGTPRATLGEAQARYEAQRRRLPPVGDDPDAPPPANQAAPRDELSAHERRIRDRLRAEGILEATAITKIPVAAPAPAPERPARHLDPVRKQVEALLAAGAPLEGLDLAGADLSDLDFSGRSLSGSILKGTNLRGARLVGARLDGAQIGGADLTDADLSDATLTLADLTGAVLDGAKLDGAELTLAVLEDVAGERASLRRTRGHGPRFAGGRWTGAHFDKAELASADFSRATLDDAVFDGASLPEVRLYDARGVKVSFAGARMPEARADGVWLRQSTLRGAGAPGSVWDSAALDETSFLGADLAEASFAKASLRRAVLAGADLREARLGRSVLAGASFLRANLMGAQLEGADLTGADLRASNLHGAETWKADLHGADLELALLTQSKLAGASRP